MAPFRLAAALAAILLSAPPARAAEAFIVLQRSPLAAFRHYDGREAWPELRVGAPLALAREPDNPYDANAVRVEWQGRKLGYVPRRENAAVARHLDRGTALEARIAALRQNRNRTVRIELEIVAPLATRGNGK
jgi:hypothetical protein